MEGNKSLTHDERLKLLLRGVDQSAITREQPIETVAPLTCQSAGPSLDTPCWWKCSNNDQHVWFATAKTRTGERVRCPFCSPCG